MPNTQPYNGTQQITSNGALIFTNSLFNASTSSNPTNHKSFDFSNINVDSGRYGHLKQYHQTRIYVQDFNGITTNGQKLGADNTYIISGNLPDSFQYRIGSEWGSPLSDIFKGVGNLALQLGSAAAMKAGGNWAKIGSNFRSGINRAANFLIWSGAKPLGIQLRIPVIDDDSYHCSEPRVRTNLKEALEFLGCLSLPTLDLNSALGFYTPAPSPLNIDLTYKKRTFNFAPNKARIMVQIGGMLFIDNCIIKGVSVNYPNTKNLMMRSDGSLTPVLAEVTIDITTIETLTSGTYTKMLWMNQQADQGRGEFNVDKVLEAGKKVIDYGKNAVKDIYNTNKEFYFNGAAVTNKTPVKTITSQTIQDASVSSNIIGNGGMFA